MSAIEYIRDYYKVPAKLRGKILYDGKPGTITGTSGPHLLVRPDRAEDRKYKKTRWILHPTWHVEYVADGKEKEEPDGE